MSGFLRRFPTLSAILPVYAVIATPIFGWTITSWLWKLPSWLNFLTPEQIAGIFFYAMMTAFIESFLVCSLLLLLSFVLPPKAFRDQFVVRGTWFALGLTVSIIGNGIWRGMTRFTYAEISLVLWSAISMVMIIFLMMVSPRVSLMSRAAAWISDRFLIFLYILIPLSVISILIVIIRNTFSG